MSAPSTVHSGPRFETALHRRMASGSRRFAYLTGSAAILEIDAATEAALDAFAVPGGLPLGAWARAGDGGEEELRSEVLAELLQVGLLQPVGEGLPILPALPPQPHPLLTLVLNVSNRCNLACTYCYEYGEDRLVDPGAGARPARMTAGTAREAVDFLFANAPGRRAVSVTFFGGETLLNMEAIEAAVAHAEIRARETGREVSLALTTNATLLSDEVIDFLVQHRFGVNVSIDGDREAQDRHRRFRSGSGSYDRVVPRIRALLARATPRTRPIGARVTVTAGAPDLVETFRHLTLDIGFDEVGFAPVTSAPGRPYALDGAAYWEMLQAFSVLGDEFVAAASAGRPHGFANLNDVLRELHLGVNKAHPCGAGLGLLGVATDGEIAPCHRFVESKSHALGTLAAGLDEEKRRHFLERGHISTKLACHECFARPLCSGGCYHEAYVRYRDAAQPNLHYCEWIRAWTDLALSAYARIMDAAPEFFARYEGHA